MKNNNYLELPNIKILDGIEKECIDIEKLIVNKELARKIKEAFTEDLEEKIIKKMEDLIIRFPAFFRKFENDIWKNAFNSKEITNKISKLYKEEELKQYKSNYDFFHCIKDTIIFLSYKNYIVLKYYKNSYKTYILVNMKIIVKLLLELCNLVSFCEQYFKIRDNYIEWMYDYDCIEIHTVGLNDFLNNIINKIYKQN